MKKYDYIILDWDGNLAKTLDVWLEAFKVVFSRRGYFPKDEDIAAAFGQMPVFAKELGLKDTAAAMDEADIIAKQSLPSVALYPDALEVLEYLHQKQKHMALLTTSIHENIKHTLDEHDMMKYFEVVITGDDLAHHKPHPEGVEKALANMKGDKNQAIIIGDSNKDVGVANNTDIDSILFYPPEHKKFYKLDELQALSPTYTIEDFREIKKIIV